MIVFAIGVAAYAFYRVVPPNTLNPFCTYDLTYRLDATIEVGGLQYSSSVIHQHSYSRPWIEVLNSSGCSQTYGTALSFRLDDNRVVLLSSDICGNAKGRLADSEEGYFGRRFSTAMAEHRKVDVAEHCVAISKDRRAWYRFVDGYVVDNATKPSRWHGFIYGEELPERAESIRLISATAEATDSPPADDLDRVAPAILDTCFEIPQWDADRNQSPNAIAHVHRGSHLAGSCTLHAVRY